MSEPLDLSELSPAAREALEFLKQNFKVDISVDLPYRNYFGSARSKVTITVSLCDEVISESNDLIEFPDP
jgi:hypothetical protein